MTTTPPKPLGPATGCAPTHEEWDGALPTDEQILADMHGWTRLVARQRPILERTNIQVSWVLRYGHVERLLNHAQTRALGQEIMTLRGITEGPLHDWWGRIVLTAHGERHTRLRAPLQRTFAFPVIAQRRERVRSLVEARLDELQGAGEVDFIEALAAEIPSQAICDLLGVPKADIPVFRQWADTLGQAFGFLTAQEVGPIDDAVSKLTDYVSNLVADRRAHPRDDFLTAFIQAVSDGEIYSEEELLAQILGLIFAGSDTTRTALAVAMTLLLQHRDQWDLLIGQRDLMRQAVDETLRFEPTVGSLPRVVVDDFEMDGLPFKGGSIIILSISAAQRDPERYQDPDRFDITRGDLPRMAIGFGGGAHRCLGEALARMEVEETLDALATRIPHIDLAGPLPHFVAMATGIRRLEDMRVRL